MIYDTIIIGGGPAGFTAGIYSARANFSTLILEGSQPGGQLTETTEVENYPGFAKGIMGPELMNTMREQAKRFGAESKFEVVTKVELEGDVKKVYVGETVYEAKAVIIATGARARYLGLESEEKFKGRGVSACATCDGFFFSGKTVAVVGGGDSAMEEATFLTKFASKVYILNRTEDFKASTIMLDRAKANEKIEILTNVDVAEVVGDQAVTGVKLRNTVSGEISDLALDGLFIAIGHTPNIELFKEQLDLDERGYLVTGAGNSRTKIPGVFAAGDVQDNHYQQAVTAAGSGCIAALDAKEYLESKKD